MKISDKVILGLCSALTATGIVMIHKGLKGLEDLRKQEDMLIEMKEEFKRKESVITGIGKKLKDDIMPILEKAEAL